ncbi:MAG: leucyl/phenylalanyl-tRNA--protein transferase [Gemmobacter sp.]|nr:leucyl/phenylalanyl-tRNA--protein transferase [Gemmobacter sp.]
MRLTAKHLLQGYAMGIFPMAASRDDPTVHWVDPRHRGILPLDKFHISRSLARSIMREDYEIRTDSDFAGVVAACGDRPETWINPEIHNLYLDLHREGFAHSLEVWDGDLIGGVYGVVLGTAFFGESMFSRRTDASKIALAWLVHRLRAGGFTLFDTQFQTPHLASLGAVEITRGRYRTKLAKALEGRAQFDPAGYAPNRYSVTQRSTQTS